MHRFSYIATRLLNLIVASVLLAGFAFAQARDYEQRFDVVWRLVAERYWGLEHSGIDWSAQGERYRPQAAAAKDDDAFYTVVQELYLQLGDDHSVFVPPAEVEAMREKYGTLPCVAVFAGVDRPPVSTAALLTYPLLAQVELPELAEPATVANLTYGLLDAYVGYLRLPDLASDGVSAGLRAAVRALEADGATTLVLDLRGNPGGRLVTMMEVAGAFTSGFLWRTITSWTLPLPYPAIGPVITSLPLVVLIDGGVNSAAEGLAGALQASGRATVVGQRSAGNVEALLPFCLRDGSQAWIATGVLAPLRGPTWEGRGVSPDVEAPAGTELAAALALLEERR